MNLPSEFTELLSECADLIDDSGLLEPNQRLATAEPLPSLLERCVELTERQETQEPVRTLHHFACTGGTLLAKCLASMPNVQLLSEVAPYSQMKRQKESRFAPTDLIKLIRSSSRGGSKDLEEAIFTAGIAAVYDSCGRNGEYLVLREHSHSKYCFGESILAGKDIRGMLTPQFAMRSVVSVRHPLDSYLSMHSRGWLNFEPRVLEEYARRYTQFLDDHDDMYLLRYEDFVDQPGVMMKQVCDALALPFDENFEASFSVILLSGNSGRSAPKIAPRERRSIPDEVREELGTPGYRALCGRLGYEPEGGRAK